MKLINRYGFLLILIILAMFFPQSLSNHAKLTMRVVITGFAIDKNGQDSYEVTAQAVIPSPSIQGGSGEAKIDFISEKGSSISDCINKIAYKIGKTDALSHTNFVMIGSGVTEENIIAQLDYFNRSEKLADNILLLITDGNAKEMIQKTKDLDMSVAVAIQRVFIDKEQNINGLMVPVHKLYNSSFTKSKTLVVSGINIQNENEQSSNASSGGQSGVSLSSSKGVTSGSESSGNSSSGTGEESQSQGGGNGGTDAGKGQARIDFLNNIYLFDNGNMITQIDDPDLLLGYYMSLRTSKYGEISFKLIDTDYDEIQLGLNIRSKKVKYKYYFEDNLPVVDISVVIDGARIYEITDAKQGNNGLFYEQDNTSIKKYKREIEEYISSLIEKLCKKTQFLNFDLYDAADNLYKFNSQDWNEYHTIVGDDGYVGDIQYKVSCEVNNLY